MLGTGITRDLPAEPDEVVDAVPCSYQDLRELKASGEDPPPELGMSRDELETLVAQLDELNAFLSTFDPSALLAASADDRDDRGRMSSAAGVVMATPDAGGRLR